MIDSQSKIQTYTIPKKKSSFFLRKKWVPYLYLLPAVLFISAFFLYSAVYTFYISFTDFNGINTPKFIGLQNYIEVIKDPILLNSVKNTVIWVIATLILPVAIGLFLAVVLQNLKGKTFYKNVFYLPYAISLTTTGVIWSFLLSPNGLDSLFHVIGLDGIAKDWLNQPPLNTYSMIISSTWQGMGTNMVMFLTGLQAIPKEPIEAAMLEGASGFRMFRSVLFPMMKPITVVVVGMALVNSFKVFDIIWVMTQGGPYYSSETLAVSMYRESFTIYKLGVGAAIAIMLSVIVMIFSWGYLRVMLKKGE